MRKREVFKFLLAILICQAAGVVGSFFTSPSIRTWYAVLRKPGFTPPNWLFGPVWITLYFLMGLALYLVWRKGLDGRNKRALLIFAIQLGLNIFWSIIFFGLHLPFLAFLEIIILWVAILMTIIVFSRISKTAGLLLLPYILWVSFAGILNFALWQLNF